MSMNFHIILFLLLFLFNMYLHLLVLFVCISPSAGESASPPPDPAKPVAEMGLSETAHCVTWANFAPRTLIASMNLKYIKIFDLRGM